MNREQIATATALFYERDRVQRLLDVVSGDSGLAVAITGDYQKDDVLQAVKPSLVNHFECKLKGIDEQLEQLGWDGQ